MATLALIIANPVSVEKTPGAIELPKLLYLLDTSQSMAIGKGATRWDQALNVIRQAARERDPRKSATLSMFRFGSPPGRRWTTGFAWPDAAAPPPRGEPDAVLAAGPSMPAEQPPAPTDPDTLLGESLEGVTDRFGPVPPQALVVFSDGREPAMPIGPNGSHGPTPRMKSSPCTCSPLATKTWAAMSPSSAWSPPIRPGSTRRFPPGGSSFDAGGYKSKQL